MNSKYDILVEETKHGRKIERQYAIYSILEDKVIARYEKEKDARSVLDNYEAALKTV